MFLRVMNNGCGGGGCGDTRTLQLRNFSFFPAAHKLTDKIEEKTLRRRRSVTRPKWRIIIILCFHYYFLFFRRIF